AAASASAIEREITSTAGSEEASTTENTELKRTQSSKSKRVQSAGNNSGMSSSEHSIHSGTPQESPTMLSHSQPLASINLVTKDIAPISDKVDVDISSRNNSELMSRSSSPTTQIDIHSTSTTPDKDAVAPTHLPDTGSTKKYTSPISITKTAGNAKRSGRLLYSGLGGSIESIGSDNSLIHLHEPIGHITL
ncbi:MAG: hypothetical protein ABW095_18390, partial [Candidatus Thiodiazotropha sp.]